MKNRVIVIMICVALIVAAGCTDFLDDRPQLSLVVPSTLADLQAILDDYNNVVNDPTYGEISADDYYLLDEDWLSIADEGQRRAYAWEKDYLFGTGTATDWLNVYRNVYTSNTVLEKIQEIPRNTNNEEQWDDIKGQALFLRARSFLSVAGVWTLAYDPNTAGATLGIPLRLGTDFNVPSVRASLQETYDVILADLKASLELLPTSAMHVSRASKPAAFALLARTLLYMRDYKNCLEAANECLQLKDDLMDYNALNAGSTYPIPQFNEEVIYVSHIATPQPINPNRAKITTDLYAMYDANDLRKRVFFMENSDGSVRFKGSYQGNITMFSGLATDEVFLMRAECYVRLDRIKEALDDLDRFMKSRWNAVAPYEKIRISDKEDLLELILKERRKSLLMRGIRWPDVKRLNMEGQNIVMSRNLQGREISLMPNDLRYALPIPERIVELSGMPQNPR